MASKAGLNGLGITYMVVGGISLWSGITNKGFGAILKSVISDTPIPIGKGKSNLGDVPASDLALTGTQNAGSSSAGTGTPDTGLPSAGTYSHAELMTLWQQAGGSSSSANNAACHAIQESSGNPQAINKNGPGPGCDAVGLWQLATPCGVGKGYTAEELMNAMTNARLTVFATHNGSDWSQWSTPGC